MDDQTRARIEKEADTYSNFRASTDRFKKIKRNSYIGGAVAEHSRITELLKEERNKAIDECIEALKVYGFGEHGKIMALETLKGKQQ